MRELYSEQLFRKDVDKSNCLIELQPIENEGPSQNRPLRDIGDLSPRQTRDSFMDIGEGNQLEYGQHVGVGQ